MKRLLTRGRYLFWDNGEPYSLVVPPTRGKGQDWVLVLDAIKA